MTEGVLPAPLLELLAPEAVTPGLLVLVGEETPTRFILTAGAGAADPREHESGGRQTETFIGRAAEALGIAL